MSKILEQVQALVALGDVRVSLHGYEELAADTIPVHDMVSGLGTAVVVEYPDYPKGPCALVLEQDGKGQPIHVLWVSRRGKIRPPS